MSKNTQLKSDADELLELLSASPEPASPEDGVTEDSVLDGEMLAEIDRKLSQIPPAVVITRTERSRTGPWLAAGTVLAVILASGVGLLAWSEVHDMSREVDVHDVVSSALIGEMSERDEALLALQAAHLEEMDRLKDAIADLALDTSDADPAMTELETRLEEVRAEAMETEINAMGADDKNDGEYRSTRGHGHRDRDVHSADPGLRGTTSSVASVSPGQIDDNPYDGVSSATNLNSMVWGTREDKKGDSSIDGLISSALVAPSKATSTVGSSRSNSLPSSRSDLPPRPTREAVTHAMEGIAASVKSCARESSGRLVLKLRVTGATGRVIDAATTDPIHGKTPEGNCAARAARLAKFPPFSSETVTIKYPFDLGR